MTSPEKPGRFTVAPGLCGSLEGNGSGAAKGKNGRATDTAGEP